MKLVIELLLTKCLVFFFSSVFYVFWLCWVFVAAHGLSPAAEWGLCCWWNDIWGRYHGENQTLKTSFRLNPSGFLSFWDLWFEKHSVLLYCVFWCWKISELSVSLSDTQQLLKGPPCSCAWVLLLLTVIGFKTQEDALSVCAVKGRGGCCQCGISAS